MTVDNFDPLMRSMFAIMNNCLRVLNGPGTTAYLLAGDDVPEDPVEGYGPKGEGRVWPRCPLCYLNQAHELTCGGCHLDPVRGYDWMIEKAADEQAEAAEHLG